MKKKFVAPQTELTVALAKAVAISAELKAQRVQAEGDLKALEASINAAVEARVSPAMLETVQATQHAFDLMTAQFDAAKLTGIPLDAPWKALCSARRELEAAKRELRRRTDAEWALLNAADGAIQRSLPAIVEADHVVSVLCAAVQAETKARIAECLLKKQERRRSA